MRKCSRASCPLWEAELKSGSKAKRGTRRCECWDGLMAASCFANLICTSLGGPNLQLRHTHQSDAQDPPRVSNDWTLTELGERNLGDTSER